MLSQVMHDCLAAALVILQHLSQVVQTFGFGPDVI
jgi:hypothetical protein